MPQPTPRKPRALVLRSPQPARAIDWSSWMLDPETDKMQSPAHDLTATMFESALKVLAAQREWEGVLICKDTAFAWVPDEPRVCVSPDVYLLQDPLLPPPSSWQTWLPGHKPPVFALEVVSSDRIKEYDVNPSKYASLGASELVIFDAEGLGRRRNPHHKGRLTRYVREQDGQFTLRESHDERIFSRELSAFLLYDAASPGQLRLSSNGNDFIPTEGELALLERAEKERERAEKERERAEKERERAEKEHERAEKERERAARVDAESEIIRLRAELTRLRAPDGAQTPLEP
jgi:Uma2 family endonuclease